MGAKFFVNLIKVRGMDDQPAGQRSGGGFIYAFNFYQKPFSPKSFAYSLNSFRFGSHDAILTEKRPPLEPLVKFVFKSP